MTESSRAKAPLFLALACVSGVGAITASLWWSYGGESTAAAVTSYALLGVAALLAFVGGFRGEHRRWGVSPVARGLLTAMIAAAATFLGFVVANFRTEVSETEPASKEAGMKPTALVATAAREVSGFGHVVSVRCPKSTRSLCVVMYDAPACQLWTVKNVEGVGQPVALGDPRPGRASYHETRDSVGCIYD
jgi:hypothetical protein